MEPVEISRIAELHIRAQLLVDFQIALRLRIEKINFRALPKWSLSTTLKSIQAVIMRQ